MAIKPVRPLIDTDSCLEDFGNIIATIGRSTVRKAERGNIEMEVSIRLRCIHSAVVRHGLSLEHQRENRIIAYSRSIS